VSFTPEQIILLLIIMSACGVLALARPRAQPGMRKAKRRRDLAPEVAATPTQAAPTSARRAKIALALTWLIVAVFVLGRGGDPIGIRPDSWSDANVVVAGRNYARTGLLAHGGAAQHQVITDQNPSDPCFLYTRYPILSSLVNGLWQRIGIQSPRVHRLLPALCSLTAVLVWFGIFARFSGPVIASVACMVMATCYAFLAYADNLFFHGYALLALAGGVWVYLRAMEPDEHHRLRWFGLAALLMFVMALFTWEYHLFAVIFIALYAFAFASPVRRGYLALLALPLVVALGLQVAQRRAALDGNEHVTSPAGAAGTSFLDDIYRRTLGFSRSSDSPPGLTLVSYPLFVAGNFFKVYGVPALAAAAMLLAVLIQDRSRAWRRLDSAEALKLLLILVAAGAGWWLVMLQHTAVHPHVMRHALPAYALLMALTAVRAVAVLRSARYGPLARVAAALLLSALLYSQLEGLICNLRMHLSENFVDARGRSDSGVQEGQWFAQLERAVPSGAVILTNHNRLPLMRLWSRRPVYSGFLFALPHNKRASLELTFNHLRDLYRAQLPPLYYVHLIWEPDIQREFASEALLRLMLTGSMGSGESEWQQARIVLEDVQAHGRTARSFCPVVAQIGPLLCFQIDRAVPLMHRDFDPFGFPSLQEFGPAP
jgi:hypothetical protein